VVDIAKDHSRGALLVKEGEVNHPVTRTPPQSMAQVANKGQAPMGAKTGCDLCAALGVGNASHKREWCFIDPQSRAYKPDVRAKRIRDAQKAGITVPQWILD
jgi:hypothetical protein